MPLKPNADETQSEFISRCHSAEKDSIPDQDQRTAACFSMWRQAKGETTNAHVDFAIQISGPVRTEQLEGREMRVVSATLVKSQILRNNLGVTYLPPAALTPEWAAIANGSPVVTDHPVQRGAPMIARTPEVLNSMGVGRLFRTRIENAALKGDVFLDPSRVESVPDLGVILVKLDNGEKVELSTGFPVMVNETPGVLNGVAYEREIWPSGFDHLAVFANQTGACSVNDGCGLAANHEGDCVVEDIAVDEKVAGRFTQAIDKLVAFLSGPKPETQPAETAGDLPPNGDNMDRKAMIAQLVAAGRNETALSALSDCDVKALLAAATITPPPPTGDPDDIAALHARIQQLLTENETLQATTKTAVQQEKAERLRLIEELIHNGHTAYTDKEIQAMDIVNVRKLHNTVFARNSYAGRGGPRAAADGISFKPAAILAGNAGESVLEQKEAN